jgi:hypothetical protein
LPHNQQSSEPIDRGVDGQIRRTDSLDVEECDGDACLPLARLLSPSSVFVGESYELELASMSAAAQCRCHVQLGA